MTTAAVKITRKGQVTIPKEIRDKLKSSAVYFEVRDDVVIMKPVRDAAGSLSEYARNVRRHESMKQMKQRAWEEVVREEKGGRDRPVAHRR
jgi:AbrB family looped-hinge helix DNA binding protein